MSDLDHEHKQEYEKEKGCVSALDSDGRAIWIADAHRGDGQRFIVRAGEKLIALLKCVELETAIRNVNRQ